MPLKQPLPLRATWSASESLDSLRQLCSQLKIAVWHVLAAGIATQETRGLKREQHGTRTLSNSVKSSESSGKLLLQHFLGRYRVMLENGGRDPSTLAGRELRDTVLDRRQEEARAAMFSHWSSAAYAWNKEETGGGVQPPSPDFWTSLLVGCCITLSRPVHSFRANAQTRKFELHLMKHGVQIFVRLVLPDY